MSRLPTPAASVASTLLSICRCQFTWRAIRQLTIRCRKGALESMWEPDFVALDLDLAGRAFQQNRLKRTFAPLRRISPDRPQWLKHMGAAAPMRQSDLLKGKGRAQASSPAQRGPGFIASLKSG